MTKRELIALLARASDDCIIQIHGWKQPSNGTITGIAVHHERMDFPEEGKTLPETITLTARSLT